jgi:hypothetical protein
MPRPAYNSLENRMSLRKQLLGSVFEHVIRTKPRLFQSEMVASPG